MPFEQVEKRSYSTNDVPRGGALVTCSKLKNALTLRVRLCSSLLNQLSVNDDTHALVYMGSKEDTGKFKIVFDNLKHVDKRKLFDVRKQKNGHFMTFIPLEKGRYLTNIPKGMKAKCEAIRPTTANPNYIMVSMPDKALEEI
jgi:hypothetical protein